jgi:acetoin:2,6-dichlorophenolindophenol oxidoreductase subunit beta
VARAECRGAALERVRMSEVTYRQAINAALDAELAADPDVFLLGEDIGAGGGVFKVTDGLFAKYGGERVFDTPISEQAIAGCALGAAMQGLRPVAEIMFSDFTAVCFDQIANQIAKYRYMTDGQVSVPLTIRMASGAGGGFAAQHSQSAEQWLLNVPGLKIVVPSTPSDAYWMLRAAIRDLDPVLYFEHKSLYGRKGEIAPLAATPTLGTATVVREGADVTIVASQLMLLYALEAAKQLAADNISAEVLDPRVLRPVDVTLIRRSVARTGRLLMVQEAPLLGSWSASVIALLAANSAAPWREPPVLLTGADTPVPYAAELEAAYLPSAQRIAAAARQLVRPKP